LLFFSLTLRGEEHEHVNGFRLTSFALPEVPATTDLQIADASRDPVAEKYVNRGFELTAFRGFGAYNDFKDEPLHGVFLVDAHGRLLWWEIGPHPYEDIAHLLDESKRLLAQSVKTPLLQTKPAPTVRRIPVAEPDARLSDRVE